LVNLDFADIRNVLINAGTAMMGMGKARGDQRAMAAAKSASTNPLLEGGSIRGARKMIMNVTGGQDLTLQEVTQAADVIRKIAAVECELVFGAVIRENLGNQLQITVIAADFQETSQKGQLREGWLRRERITEDTDLSIPAFVRRRRDTEGKPNSAN
jgi:cell division protein FtsZ